MRLCGALERNCAGKFHIRIRLINRQRQTARQRSGNGEGQLPFRHVATETHEQLELQRRFALARQQHGNRFAFAHNFCIARLGAETLHRHVFTEEHDLLTCLRCAHLNCGVELRNAVVHRASVAGGENGDVRDHRFGCHARHRQCEQERNCDTCDGWRNFCFTYVIGFNYLLRAARPEFPDEP